MFSTGYSYEGLVAELTIGMKNKKYNSSTGEYLRMLEHMKEEIQKCPNHAMKVTLENLKTTEVVTYLLIFFKERFEFTDEWYIKLAHECLHIIQFYLPDILDPSREYEAAAYLHSHLMRQALNHVRQ